MEECPPTSGSQEIPRIFGTRTFISAFTRARHLSLSLARSIQTMPLFQFLEDTFEYYLPIYVRVFQVVSFSQVSPSKTDMHLPHLSYVPHALPISFFLI